MERIEGRQLSLDGRDSKWQQWATKLRTYMISREPEGGVYLRWAEDRVLKILLTL